MIPTRPIDAAPRAGGAGAHAARARSPWIVVALCALTLLALGERWASVRALVPHGREADAAIVHYAAYYDRPAGVGMSDAVYPSTVYPVFLGRLLCLLPGSGYPIAAPADAPLEAHLAAAAAPYVRARWMILVLSLLAVPGTYLLARAWLEPWWAVFAAALAATSLLALEQGAIAKPHGALAGLTPLALWSMLRLLRVRTTAAYLLAGLATACALGALNTGCFLVPSLALAHVLGWRADRDRGRWPRFALAAALCAASFVSSYWFLFVRYPGTTDTDGALDLGQQSIAWSSWNGQGFLDLLPSTWAHDPVLVGLAGLGVLACAWALLRGGAGRATWGAPKNLVLLVFVAIFVALFGLHARYFARFSLPLLAVLALLGAVGVRALARAAGSRARVVGCALAATALAFPLYAGLHVAVLHAREDTQTMAARWIAQHLPPDAGAIGLDVRLTLPLFLTRPALEAVPTWARQPWHTYQLDVLVPQPGRRAWDLRPLFERRMFADRRIDLGEALGRLAALRPRWAVVAVPDAVEAERDATRAAVRALGGEPVAAFLPSAGDGARASSVTRDLLPLHLELVLHRTRLGPPIEVYALP